MRLLLRAKDLECAEVAQMTPASSEPDGFYSSTSGTIFADKDALSEHYRSDYHRYNLKRKVAELPPVTREWFDARKQQLNLAANSSDVQKVWYDQLTRKKFNSENTYRVAVSGKKYAELVRRSGQPAPEPIVTLRRQPAPAPAQPADPQAVESAVAFRSAGYVPKAVAKRAPNYFQSEKDSAVLSTVREVKQAEDSASMGDAEEGSGWETASDEGDEEAAAGSVAGPMAEDAAGDGAESEGEEAWDTWDVRRSLFDNHMSATFAANMEYMVKKFGFYFPDAEYLVDPEGLLQYLGAKLQYGHVPVGTPGDDVRAKHFSSLHAVQRHMVDRSQCKMAFEDNEDEYDDFYEYGDDVDPAGKEVVMADGSSEADVLTLGTGNYELSVPATEGKGRKVLGSREFALYYRQRHRAVDVRQSVTVNAMVARYRALGIITADKGPDAPVKRAQKAQRKFERQRLRAQVYDVNNTARRQAQGPGQFQR